MRSPPDASAQDLDNNFFLFESGALWRRSIYGGVINGGFRLEGNIGTRRLSQCTNRPASAYSDSSIRSGSGARSDLKRPADGRADPKVVFGRLFRWPVVEIVPEGQSPEEVADDVPVQARVERQADTSWIREARENVQTRNQFGGVKAERGVVRCQQTLRTVRLFPARFWSKSLTVPDGSTLYQKRVSGWNG